jgi:CBS domain-containing protein
MTRVKELMTTALYTVEADAPLGAASTAMTFAHSRHVPVTDQGRLRGMLSLRDLLRAQLSSLSSTELERRRHGRDVAVRQVMTPDPYTVSPEDDVLDVARLVERHRFSAVPVLRRGELVGMITTQDLIGHAAHLAKVEARGRERPLAVTHLMTPGPITTVEVGDHLDLAQTVMRLGPFRHLPVLKGGQLVGMVSDRDILAALSSSLTDATLAERLWERASITAGQVMRTPAITIGAEEPVVDAARRLRQKGISALPVMRGDKLVGILTELDFVTYLIQRTPVEDVSSRLLHSC